MSHRVLLAGLFHETHTFVDDQTGLDQFNVRRDDELLESVGDGSPLDGVFEVAEQYDWDLVPSVDYRAGPSGTVEDDVLASYWLDLEPRLGSALAGKLDALFLVLHGAMTSRSEFDVEGELLERVRRLPGGEALPIFGVYDLHANFTSRMAHNAHCLVAYRENPHADAKEAAVQAARLLQVSLETRQLPRMHVLQPPLMWPPTGTGTADLPMSALETMARSMEAEDDEIWAVNVNAGFPFADVPDAGVSFSLATTGHPGKAEELLARLAVEAHRLRELGNVIETPIADVLPNLSPSPNGPILLVEPSDNIGGGAPGDGTGVLRALLDHGMQNAAVIINDPEAVREVARLEGGKSDTLAIGGKGSSLDAGPVELTVELVSLSDGRFTLEDPHSHLAAMQGHHVHMGQCAVVRHGGVTILLTSRKTPPFDLGQLRSQGIEPRELAFIGVKAAVAHRQAYGPIAAASYVVGTPGPCTSNLSALPYRHVRRPIYPLDE